MTTDYPLIIPTPSGYQFAQKVSRHLVEKYLPERGIKDADPWVPTRVTVFADGDKKVKILRHIRDRDVYIIGDMYSTATMLPHPWYGAGGYRVTMDAAFYGVHNEAGPIELVPHRLPVDVNFAIFLSTIEAAKGAAKVRRVTAVLPCFPSARQDKRDGRESLDLKLRMDLLRTAGVDHVLTIDIHNASAELGAAGMAYDSLNSVPHIRKYLASRDLQNAFFLAPDDNSLSRNRVYSRECGAAVRAMDKERSTSEPNKILESHPTCDPCEFRDKDVFSVDDLLDTAGTMEKAVRFVMENGAKSFTMIATHGVCSYPCWTRLEELHEKKLLRELAITDSVTHGNLPECCVVLTVSKYFAKVIDHLNQGESISHLLRSEET
ncbi:MAG: ribose-phosphate diphosphokinase [Planctomycetota bacterium]